MGFWYRAPEREQADNDYAVALLIDKIAHSSYKDSTLVFVLEDDAQDGADHVDAHRSTVYIVGAYVKHGVVVSTRYATANVVRTIHDILGMPAESLEVAGVPPMTEIFDIHRRTGRLRQCLLHTCCKQSCRFQPRRWRNRWNSRAA